MEQPLQHHAGRQRALCVLVSAALAIGLVPSSAWADAAAGAASSAAAEPEAAAASEGDAAGAYAEDELIIVYEDEALALDDEVDVDAALALDGAAEDGDVTLADVGVLDQEQIGASSADAGCVVVAELDEDASVEELVDELASDPDIAYVQPNYYYEPLETTVDDPYASTDSDYCQYYLYSSGFTEAWDDVKVEGSVTIAVIDTGCNLSHEDLRDTVDTELAYDVTSDQLLANSRVANHGDSYGHGTMVCGIIAAYANNAIGIAGASYNASVLPIRVYDNKNECTTADVVEAYAYLDGLIEDGTLTDLRVINMSLGAYASGWGSAEDQAMEQAIAAMLADHDVLTVCAGGNDATTENIYPADFEECVAVTSVDEDGVFSYFSDYNDAKDIAAYGENVVTTTSDGGYGVSSGTSFSSPQVAAAAALLWAADTTLTSDDVVAALQATADEISYDGQTGDASAGILDIDEAVDVIVEDAIDAEFCASATTLTSAALNTATTKATLTWEKVYYATGYKIYRSVNGGAYKLVKTISDASTTTWTNSLLSRSRIYRYKVRAYRTTDSSTLYNSYSSAKKLTTKPAVVAISSAKTTASGNVQVKWKKAAGASGYAIYRSVNGGAYKKVKTVKSATKLKWTDTSVSPGKVYRYKVRATAAVDGKTRYSASYSSVKKVRAKPGKTTIKSVGSTAVARGTVKWKKVSGATGYQVAIRVKGTSTWYGFSVTGTSKTFTGLLNKKYYVKVRAYKTVNGTRYYGAWSTKRLMTVK